MRRLAFYLVVAVSAVVCGAAGGALAGVVFGNADVGYFAAIGFALGGSALTVRVLEHWPG